MTTKDRLQEIINNNPPARLLPGMMGAQMVFTSLFNPSLPELKRLTAEYLHSHLECVDANKRMFGTEYRGTFWLERAAIYRARALQKAVGV